LFSHPLLKQVAQKLLEEDKGEYQVNQYMWLTSAPVDEVLAYAQGV
jgi:hypothetical protein